ncbi:TIGR03773 family transporter-associated surface protein [Rothia mucilaginosa]|uniref:TIGR03773 family transporter-associated surface protein n=1 Tax=Rothia mucilaginosa TaxID=43675 RepID=UPI001956FCB2|nr:TIGR03773 family transporter-associated surface protein [Rothia mucilaginosa]VTY06898.1 anch_rpt_wall: putative ABC transporter-associated repeat protein [Rothia mucilaginosa]
MQGRTKPLSLLSATTLGCTLALGAPLALPQVGTFTAAQAQENQAGTQAGTESRTYVNYEGDYVIAGVHTEMLNAFLDGNQFTLGTLADTAPGQQGRFNPAHTVFHLPDVEDAHTTVAAGYDYIAPEGTDVFYIPSTRTRGLLYPGLGAEGIRPGALKGDTINLELVRSSVPEGGRAEVFTESGRDNPRVFSTNDQLAPHTITAGGHEHLSWAFTRAGIYQLTFRATATLTDGTPVSSEATYTIAVGTNAEDGFKLLNAQNAAKESTREAAETPEATSTATESATSSASASTSASAEAGASAEASASTGIRRMDASVNGQNAAQVTDPNGAKAAANGEQASQGGSGVTAISGADNTTNNGSDKGESKGGNSHGVKGSSVKGSNAQNVTAPGNNSGGGILSSGLPGSLNQQCIATEVPAEDAKDSQDSKSAKDSKQNAQAAQAPTGIPTLAVVNTAEHSGREEVTHGHFDVGPVLNGGNLTSSVKDDRTSPARHVSPGALEFVLNDAAKLNLPAGMEDIAPAGTPVYMIGATQQQGVPWLGWSTQDPELLKQLDGPVTMSLNGFEGPGTLSTFLSGNFGSAGQKVFDSRSGGSFQVPANTHQHSNWVFTAEGRYTVTIGWTARLKNGQQVSSESVLHFTVGNPDNAPASNNAQGAAGTKQDGGEKSTAKNPLNGTVDEATGIVTKPDGSKVRIVGKTASGEDCALTSQELANAQKAAAAGKLPNTGVVIDPFMVSTSILALALGAMILRSARRKGRSGDAA